jgi:hypothetical protein
MMTEDTKNLLVDALTGAIGKISLHNGDPGLTGENEAPVTRATPAWSAAEDGRTTVQVVFSSLSGTFTHIGFWSLDGTDFRLAKEWSTTISVPTDVTLAVEVDWL